jgi:hypothetical protein
VTAPFANLPPPAAEARPPSTLLATKDWTWKPLPLINGPALELMPSARAAGPHCPPDATAEAQPTIACPATFSNY